MKKRLDAASNGAIGKTATFRVNPRLLALADRMGTAPCKIADFFGINPFYIERLLAMRGHRCVDGETLCDLVSRIYGADCAKEMFDLIGEEVWVK